MRSERRLYGYLGACFAGLWLICFLFLTRPTQHLIGALIKPVGEALKRAHNGHAGPLSFFIGDLALLIYAIPISFLLILCSESLTLRGMEHRFLKLNNLLIRSAARLFSLGICTGLAAMTCTMGGLIATGGYSVMLPLGHMPALPLFSLLLSILGADIFLAFTEEFIFRGLALQAFTRAFGFWWAVLIIAVCFATLHTQDGDTLIGASLTGLWSTFACLTVRVTGSLFFAVGAHAAWDFAEDGLFGVADSGNAHGALLLRSLPIGPSWLTGGAAGPEASPICFVVMLALILLAARHRSASWSSGVS